MRCPFCSHAEDKVVDSRESKDGDAIRRRRECLGCGRRFTTFERIEEVGLVVTKRDGTSEPFDREKLAAGIRKAFAGRPTSPLQIEQMVGRIETRVRRKGPDVTSQQVGGEVLAMLQKVDEVAYLRYASVYKDFQGTADFQRELGMLLEKKEPARKRTR